MFATTSFVTIEINIIFLYCKFQVYIDTLEYRFCKKKIEMNQIFKNVPKPCLQADFISFKRYGKVTIFALEKKKFGMLHFFGLFGRSKYVNNFLFSWDNC